MANAIETGTVTDIPVVHSEMDNALAIIRSWLVKEQVIDIIPVEKDCNMLSFLDDKGVRVFCPNAFLGAHQAQVNRAKQREENMQ